MADAPGRHTGGPARDGLVSARTLRWRAPELVGEFCDQALMHTPEGDWAARVEAGMLAACAANRLGRATTAVERAVSAMRDVPAGYKFDPGDRATGETLGELHVELARCAVSVGRPDVARNVLRPVRRPGCGAPELRARALLAEAALPQAADARADLLDAAAQLPAQVSDADSARLVLARISAVRAVHERRRGAFRAALEATGAGRAQLQRLVDPATEDGHVWAWLALERVLSLLELGDPGAAGSLAQEALAIPARAAAAPYLGWLGLVLATRIHGPRGHLDAAIRVLHEAGALAERHGLDAVSAEVLRNLSWLQERATEPGTALHVLRNACGVERRWRAAVHQANVRLLTELPELPTVLDTVPTNDGARHSNASMLIGAHTNEPAHEHRDGAQRFFSRTQRRAEPAAEQPHENTAEEHGTRAWPGRRAAATPTTAAPVGPEAPLPVTECPATAVRPAPADEQAPSGDLGTSEVTTFSNRPGFAGGRQVRHSAEAPPRVAACEPTVSGTHCADDTPNTDRLPSAPETPAPRPPTNVGQVEPERTPPPWQREFSGAAALSDPCVSAADLSPTAEATATGEEPEHAPVSVNAEVAGLLDELTAGAVRDHESSSPAARPVGEVRTAARELMRTLTERTVRTDTPSTETLLGSDPKGAPGPSSTSPASSVDDHGRAGAGDTGVVDERELDNPAPGWWAAEQLVTGAHRHRDGSPADVRADPERDATVPAEPSGAARRARRARAESHDTSTGGGDAVGGTVSGRERRTPAAEVLARHFPEKWPGAAHTSADVATTERGADETGQSSARGAVNGADEVDGPSTALAGEASDDATTSEDPGAWPSRIDGSEESAAWPGDIDVASVELGTGVQPSADDTIPGLLATSPTSTNAGQHEATADSVPWSTGVGSEMPLPVVGQHTGTGVAAVRPREPLEPDHVPVTEPAVPERPESGPDGKDLGGSVTDGMSTDGTDPDGVGSTAVDPNNAGLADLLAGALAAYERSRAYLPGEDVTDPEGFPPAEPVSVADSPGDGRGPTSGAVGREASERSSPERREAGGAARHRRAGE